MEKAKNIKKESQLPEHLSDQVRAALRVPVGGEGDGTLSHVLAGVHPADIAEAMRDLSNLESLALFNWLDNDRAADALSDSDAEQTRYLLDNAPSGRVADLLDHLPMDDAAFIVSKATATRAEILLDDLNRVAPDDAADVRELLSYGPETAGRLMTDDFVRLSANLTVDEAFAAVRQADAEVETLTDLYIVEHAEAGHERLTGVISLRELVRAAPTQRIAEVMKTELVTVSVDSDQEEVSRLISKYKFLAMPVLDRQGFLAGIVTVDDVLDILTQEQTEDQLKFSGVSVEPGVINQNYFATPIWRVVRARVGWLVLLFVAETATGTVLRHFEDELAKVVALSFFIPLLIGTGGNTGAQTVSTIIRGLALGEIKTRDMWRVLMRELGSGILLGSLLGLVGFARAMMWGSGFQLSLVVGLTILIICAWANTIGSLIPLVAQKFNVDPALVSAPLITTLVDATGLAIYLLIAKALLTALH